MKTKHMNLAIFIFILFPLLATENLQNHFLKKVSPLKKSAVVSISFLGSSVFFPPIVLIFFLAIDHNQENLTKFGCIPNMEVKHFKHHFIYLDYNYGDFFLEIWQIMTFLTNILYTC
jgi:hypothetical protein